MPASVWRNRDFLLVLGGGLVNNIGDWLLAVGLPAFVYTETGSGRVTAAIVVIDLVIGILFGPVGGSLADRWDLRRTVIVTNLLQAVALLPLLWVTSARIWPAFLVAAIQGLLAQINDPASFSLVPRIVPDEQLVQANSANSAASSIARLVGSPLGGIAVALGGLSTVVVVDAVSFLTVAVVTSFVRTPTPSLSVNHDDDGGRRRVRVRDGWREVRRHPGLTAYLGVQSLASLAFAMFPVLFIVFVIDVLGGDEATIGIIRGMAAFGGIAAAVLIARVAKHVDPVKLMVWGYTGLGMVALLFVNMTVVTTALWVFLLLFALSGLPNMSSQIGAATTAQQLCPPAVLGRFQGLVAAGTGAGALVGSLGVAALIDVLGSNTLFNVQAALYLLCGLAAYVAIANRQPARAGDPSSCRPP